MDLTFLYKGFFNFLLFILIFDQIVATLFLKLLKFIETLGNQLDAYGLFLYLII